MLTVQMSRRENIKQNGKKSKIITAKIYNKSQPKLKVISLL